MSMIKKVLVIAEGPSDKKVIKRMFSSYGKDLEVVAFKADVYQLSSLYEKQQCDYDEIDLQQTLLNELPSLKPGEKKILEDRYVDVFLIFDFDPHASLADVNKLKKLMAHFKDSSDMGKMLESYQHIDLNKLKENEVDIDFFDKGFSVVDFQKKGSRVNYKVRAKTEGFSHCDLQKSAWDGLISHHLFKIEQKVGSLRQCDYDQVRYLELLDLQGKSYHQAQNGLVVNTSMTIVPELYPNDWCDMTAEIAKVLKK